MIFKHMESLCVFQDIEPVKATEQRRNNLSATSAALLDRLLEFYWKQF